MNIRQGLLDMRLDVIAGIAVGMSLGMIIGIVIGHGRKMYNQYRQE